MNRRKFFKLSLLTSLLAAGGYTAARAYGGNVYYKGPVSDHFDGRVFYNPGGEAPAGFSDLLKWRTNGESVDWPEKFPSPFAGSKPDARVEGSGLRVTLIGHASFLIQTAGLNFLIDPVWSERTSPFSFFGPKRVNAPGVAFEDLPPIDYVLVTHNHYDHLDLVTLKRLQERHKPRFITPLGNDKIIKDYIDAAKVTVGDWGDVVDLGEGRKIHFEPCHHWSARGLNDKRMALWAAFVIETPHGKTYHVGDTGFHSGINYKAAKAKHGSFRVTNLPIGAYEPRWFMKGQHQNPEEAVQGFLLCGADLALGHHWGTVKLTDEGIEAPLVALDAALEQHGVPKERFTAMRPGQSVDVPGRAA
jgi:L-ascorbate metabolism protein UlaG (beta-lactamase superfamily)